MSSRVITIQIMREVLEKKIPLKIAINNRGTSLKNYYLINGTLGSYQNRFKVYTVYYNKCFYQNDLCVLVIQIIKTEIIIVVEKMLYIMCAL